MEFLVQTTNTSHTKTAHDEKIYIINVERRFGAFFFFFKVSPF